MRARVMVIAIASACTSRTPPRAPEPPRGVVIMSIEDIGIEPENFAPPVKPSRAEKYPIDPLAPLKTAAMGATVGFIGAAALSLLRENRMPDDETNRKAIVYGAGIGLVAGAFVLANNIAQRVK